MAHILIVDDEPSVRGSLARLLELEGHHTLVARDGNAALESVIAPGAVDLVLLDLDLGGNSGLAVLQRLRIVRPDVPVAILTATCDPRAATAAIQLGAIDYLVKPLQAPRLRELIRAALGRPLPPADGAAELLCDDPSSRLPPRRPPVG